MSEEDSGSLLVKLREAESGELERLLQEHLEELDVPAVRQLLRNPFMTTKVAEMLIGDSRLLGNYEIRRDLAAHPKTPKVNALRMVSTLYWRDLVKLAREIRTPPAIRRAAELQLVSRLPGLGAGEKRSIARQGGPGVIAQLRRDPDPMVIEALLENPRLTEGSLLPLVSSETTKPEVLTVVARDKRWGIRYPVRQALCKNPRTPAVTTLPLLPMLKKIDLAAVARDRRIPAPVRKRAELLLGRNR
ncbi:MAG: hypothetical protein EP299_12195 [Acidobacteria bacterium]|nr:MAG: hypothetical protein EP299_12195 [Acidobacteriota bacterium]